jgi:hypothetical protein
MCKFYLNKSRKYKNVVKMNKDGIFVQENHRYVGKVQLKSGTILNIKLFEGYKPGGPSGSVPKNPNKMIIDIKEKK